MDNTETARTVRMTREDLVLIWERRHALQLDTIGRFGPGAAVDMFCLPQPYMAALETAVLHFGKGVGKYGKGFAEAELTITQNDPWFWSHFIGDPIMPGSQGTDAIYQLAGVWAACSEQLYGRARALEGKFTYKGQVLPTSSKVYYRLDVTRFLPRRKTLFFEGHLAVDDPGRVVYTFTDCQLGFFTQDELALPSGRAVDYYRPDWAAIRREMMTWIDRAERFYAGEKEAEREGGPR